MRFDVYPEDQWFDLNNRVRGMLGVVQNRVTTRVYRGVAHGLKEFAIGLTQSFPHKKSVAIIQHASPWFDCIEKILMREAFSIQKISVRENLLEWAKNLAPDTIFVLVPEDHAITAEIFDHSELVDELFRKGIYVIRVSHFKHRYQRFAGFINGEVRPLEVRVLSYSPEFCVGILGGRARLNPVIAAEMFWDISDKSLEHMFATRSEFQDLIEAFESHHENRFEPVLKHKNRLWDRALIEFENLSGDFVIHKLSEELGEQLTAAGFEASFETTHLCRWQSFRLWQWTDRISWERLVALDPQVLKNAKLKPALDKLDLAQD